MIVKNLETKNTKITSQTINGFSFKALIYADTFTNGDTTYGSSKIDWSKVAVKAILNRGGKEHILFQDNLQILGTASTLNTVQQLAFFAGVDHSIKLGDGMAMVCFNLPLAGHINLKGEDYIYLEVTNQPDLFVSTHDQNSYIEVKELKSIGYETFLPSIRSSVIQAGTTSEKYSLGSNVLRTAILNYDKTNFATPIIVTCSMSSDRLSESFSYHDLINMKLASLPKLPPNLYTEAGNAFELDQSFLLTDFNNIFNDLTLDLQLNGSNVAASKNYLVYWSCKYDPAQLAKSEEMANKHEQKLLQTIASSGY